MYFKTLKQKKEESVNNDLMNDIKKLDTLGELSNLNLLTNLRKLVDKAVWEVGKKVLDGDEFVKDFQTISVKQYRFIIAMGYKLPKKEWLNLIDTIKFIKTK